MVKEVKKHPLNAPGRYYVDQDRCTFSGNCEFVAPEHFERDAAHCVYVVRQPATAEEEARCRQALEECPVEAIRDDGAG